LAGSIVCGRGDRGTLGSGRAVGVVRAGGAAGSDTAARWRSAQIRGPRSTGGGHLCRHVRLYLAAAASVFRAVQADGPSTLHRVEQGQGVGKAPPSGVGRAGLARGAGLDSLCDRLGEHAGPERRDLTGPNPVDRGKNGSKILLLTERTGLPISVGISGANLHDSHALEPLVGWIPPIRSRRGPRRRRPAKLRAEKGYDSDRLPRWLRSRGRVAE
jgi:hypothetical protein